MTTSRFVAPDSGDEVAEATPSKTPRKSPEPIPQTPFSHWVRELILRSELRRPRTLQRHIGPSQVGEKCDRQLAMTMMGADPVAFSDPLKAWVGTGVHLSMQNAVEEENASRRYLTEHPVTYRGISGSVDFFDRLTGAMADWKSKELAKIRAAVKASTDEGYAIQQQVYAAGLQEQGERVNSIHLVYIPVNGKLDDIYDDYIEVDRSVADAAIDRLEALENRVADGEAVEQFAPYVSALCPWCPFYSPDAPLSARTCPGKVEQPIATVPAVEAPLDTPKPRRRRAAKTPAPAVPAEASTEAEGVSA